MFGDKKILDLGYLPFNRPSDYIYQGKVQHEYFAEIHPRWLQYALSDYPKPLLNDFEQFIATIFAYCQGVPYPDHPLFNFPDGLCQMIKARLEANCLKYRSYDEKLTNAFGETKDLVQRQRRHVLLLIALIMNDVAIAYDQYDTRIYTKKACKKPNDNGVLMDWLEVILKPSKNHVAFPFLPKGFYVACFKKEKPTSTPAYRLMLFLHFASLSIQRDFLEMCPIEYHGLLAFISGQQNQFSELIEQNSELVLKVLDRVENERKSAPVVTKKPTKPVTLVDKEEEKKIKDKEPSNDQERQTIQTTELSIRKIKKCLINFFKDNQKGGYCDDDQILISEEALKEILKANEFDLAFLDNLVSEGIVSESISIEVNNETLSAFKLLKPPKIKDLPTAKIKEG